MYFSAYRSKEKFRCLIKSLVPFEVTRDTRGTHEMSDLPQDLGWTLVHTAELRVSLWSWHIFARATRFLPALLSSNTKACSSSILSHRVMCQWLLGSRLFFFILKIPFLWALLNDVSDLRAYIQAWLSLCLYHHLLIIAGNAHDPDCIPSLSPLSAKGIVISLSQVHNYSR